MFEIIPPTMLGGFKEPPTLYSLMESIVNYNKVNKTPIKDLCKEARHTIFDFSYPLSEKVNKEDFECMILNHFINRRIGFTVYTPWRIALETKLNEIMPFYNKMFDMLDGWDIFKDGETTERIVEDSRTTENHTSTETNSNSSSEGYNEKTVSDTPQNELDDIRDNKYADDFEHSNNSASSQDSSNSSGTSNTSDSGNLRETTKRSPADKMKLYREYLENKNHIYSLIFSELNCLFYGLV